MVAVCCVPVSPMRSEPSHKSEMVSQMVFGESCEILEENRIPWIRIRCRFDGYEGWCQDTHISYLDPEQHGNAGKYLTPECVTTLKFNGSPMMVPMGSSIPVRKNNGLVWGENCLFYEGVEWDPDKAEKNALSISQLARKFLNTAYLWGGKSIFGIDCSGYTQTVYKFFGIHLLRDAHQQALQGETIGFLEESLCGDLAFFDNTEGIIVHVGILLNDHEIIHASGKVRIDKIDNSGIIHSENSRRTHHLKILKRFF
jgi:gamma-D-glutamyl-L-lysine dipeptidyl-peptidase